MSYFPKGHHAADDDVDDFDEYDSTPYSGGYDITLTYGRPLPPSEETCYQRTFSASDECDFDRPQYDSGCEPSAYADQAVLDDEYQSYARPKPRPAPQSYQGRIRPGGGSEYGESYQDPDYGSGYGKKPNYPDPYSEYGGEPGHGRRSEYEQPPAPEYGSESEYGRRPEYDQQLGSEYGYERRHEISSNYGRSIYNQTVAAVEYERPSYGRSEEEDYRKPRYEKKNEEDDDEEEGGYRRKKYGDDDDDDDDQDEEKHRRGRHHHHRKHYDD